MSTIINHALEQPEIADRTPQKAYNSVIWNISMVASWTLKKQCLMWTIIDH